MIDKYNIMLVAPTADVATCAEEIKKELGLQLNIKLLTDQLLDDILNEAMSNKIDGIISRGGIALRLLNANCDIPVAEIPVTEFDIIEAVNEAQKVAARIALIGFPNIIYGISRIKRILDIGDCKVYIRSKIDDSEQRIADAVSDGAEVLVGDAKIAAAAKLHNIPCIAIKSGKESILQAYEKLNSLISLQKQERLKASRIEAILQNIYTGIIAVDEQNIITTINSRAEVLLNVTAKQVQGDALSKYLPMVIQQEKEKEQPELGIGTFINKKRVIINRVPIFVEGTFGGVVYTLQEVVDTHSVEKNIQEKRQKRGHVARFTFDSIIGFKSKDDIIKQARNYSNVDANILITGESGVGKEIFAQSIHNASPRTNGPFVAVNCASLPNTLLESELFGYVKGAFTGAKSEGKVGLFEQANKGTILLDEVTEMPLELQARLLRVIQEKEIIRIGDDRVISVDCRIIATSNRNLTEEVAKGNFRSDLFYRLNILNLHIPPLRERTEDIAELANFFIRKIGDFYNKPVWNITPGALTIFKGHNWNGNVREFAAVIERAVVLTNKNVITEEEVSYLKPRKDKPESNASTLDSLALAAIQRELTFNKGSKEKTATSLGISRTTLWRKLKKGN